MSNQRLWGYQQVQLADGSELDKPIIGDTAVNTQLLLRPNQWLAITGLKKKSSEGQETELMYFVRVIPPDENIYKDSNQKLHFTVNNAH